MKKILIWTVVAIVILLLVIPVFQRYSLATASRQAAKTLAGIVVNYDDEYGEMAAKALIETRPENVLEILETGFDSSKSGCEVRSIMVMKALMPDESVDIFVKALADNDIYVSTEAGLALARMDWEEVLDTARDRLEHFDPLIVGKNYQIIAYFDETILDDIEEELGSDDGERQSYIIWGLTPLVENGNDRAWGLLKRAITSRHPEVREAALDASIELGGKWRMEALTIAAGSSDISLNITALREMSRGENPEQYKETFRLALNHPDIDIKFTAAWALIDLRDPEPVRHLRLILSDKKASQTNKIIAARILQRLGAPEGADPMYEIIDDPTAKETTILEAAEVLGEYGDIKGMGILGEAIKEDKDVAIRKKALSLLGLMDDKNATALLLELTEDKDESIAVRAAYALVALGDRRGISKLKKFLKSDSIEVRTLAGVGILTGGDITDIVGEKGYG